MAPELRQVASFSLDIEDWYSCTASDDEAYEEALERNSNASYYTARGAASSAASYVRSSAALGSPTRLADADRALAEMVPEPLSDPRLQHEPPDMDERELPVAKRTRSLSPELTLPRTFSAGTPGLQMTPKAETCCTTPARATSRSSLGEVHESEGTSTAHQYFSDVRVCITVLPDGSSVQVQISPSVFVFGSASLPAPSGVTDYAAMLLGPEGGLSAENSSFGPMDLLASPREDPTSFSPQQIAASQDESSPQPKASSHLDSAYHNDPITPKDQNKTKRQPVGKERKSGGGFPGAFLLHRLFSGLRSSRGGADPQSVPAATVEELGSELLLASAAAGPAGLEVAAAAAQSAPVIAAFVHGSAPPAVPVVSDAGNAPDDAAAAVQRLSAIIFRNVLRASEGGAPSPKPFTSPRDTAFLQAEPATPQRDQTFAIQHGSSRSPSEGCMCRSPTPPVPVPVQSSSVSPQPQPEDRPQEPGLAALALLIGLATDVVPAPSADEQHAEDALAAFIPSGATAAQIETALEAHVRTNVQYGCELPAPALEQCDSPVGATGAAAASSDNKSPEVEPAPQAAASSPGDAASSPRTVSRKAYGTIARLVQKLAPTYRDSVMKSCVSTDMPAGALHLAKAITTEDAPPTAGDVVGVEQTLASPAAPAAADSKALEVSATVEEACDQGSSLDAPTASTAVVEQREDPTQAEKAEASGVAVQASPMFIFGQELPKSGKLVIRHRSAGSKAAVPASTDPPTPTEGGVRKRKADLEALPTAKLPYTRPAGADGGLAPDDAPPEPRAAEPLPSATPPEQEPAPVASPVADRPPAFVGEAKTDTTAELVHDAVEEEDADAVGAEEFEASRSPAGEHCATEIAPGQCSTSESPEGPVPAPSVTDHFGPTMLLDVGEENLVPAARVDPQGVASEQQQQAVESSRDADVEHPPTKLPAVASSSVASMAALDSATTYTAGDNTQALDAARPTPMDAVQSSPSPAVPQTADKHAKPEAQDEGVTAAVREIPFRNGSCTEHIDIPAPAAFALQAVEVPKSVALGTEALSGTVEASASSGDVGSTLFGKGNVERSLSSSPLPGDNVVPKPLAVPDAPEPPPSSGGSKEEEGRTAPKASKSKWLAKLFGCFQA